MGMWNWLGGKIFKLTGWKIVGAIPDDVRKCVIAVAPHTCIADFILGRLAYCCLDRNVRYLIKKEFFDISGNPAVSVPAGQIYLQNPGIPIPCIIEK